MQDPVEEVGPSERELRSLVACVEFGGCLDVTVVGLGQARVATRLKGLGVEAEPMDAEGVSQAGAHLGAYARYVQAAGVELDAIVLVPWFACLDVTLPLAAWIVNKFVCAYVPGRYITHAPAPRAAWFRRLQAEGRLFVKFNVARGPVERCAWVLVFRSREQRRAALRAAFAGMEVGY